MTNDEKNRPFGSLTQRIGKLTKGAEQAFQKLREGRLGAPYHTPFQIAQQTPTAELRRYQQTRTDHQHSLLLLPSPLLPPDIFDISPELSVVTQLQEEQLDVWMCTPTGKHTLTGPTPDDIKQCIAHIAKKTKRSVHVLGYAGACEAMLEATSARNEKHVGSVIALGPSKAVQNPANAETHSSTWNPFTKAKQVTKEAIPKAFRDYGITFYYPQPEAIHLARLLGFADQHEPALPLDPNQQQQDTQSGQILRTLFRRVFGPATTTTATTQDAFPHPLLVLTAKQSIQPDTSKDMPLTHRLQAPISHEHTFETGPFGLVVGAKATTEVWPMVTSWIQWLNDPNTTEDSFASYLAPSTPVQTESSATSDPPHQVAPPKTPTSERDALMPGTSTGFWGGQRSVQRLYDMATDMVDGIWTRIGEVSVDVNTVVESIRWQLPRLARLLNMPDHADVSFSQALTEQAAAIPDAACIHWQGQIWSFAQIEDLVDQLAQQLWDAGITAGKHTGIIQLDAVETLLASIAINRLGAIAVLLPHTRQEAPPMRLHHCIVDENAPLPEWTKTLPETSLIRTTTSQQTTQAGQAEPPYTLSFQTQHTECSYTRHTGTAEETACLLLTSGTPRPQRVISIDNRTWSLAALGAAAACGLTKRDTVLSHLPMTHASGLLLAASGTIIGGATLCLSANPDHWLNELQSHRATVMLYSPHSASAIATYLRSKQPFPDSLRLFVGYGLSHHAQVAALHLPETVKRTEFYSTPEANFALVQLSQHKPESVGRPLLGNEPLALAAIDPATMTPKRSSQGTLLRAAPGQPGILLFRSNKPTNNQKEDGINANFAEDPAGTIWYSTADLFTRDDEGDYTFFGKAHRTIAHEGSFIPMAKAEAALVRCPCVQDAVLFFDQSNQSWHAIIRSHQQTMFDIHAVTKALNTTLPAGHRPKKLTITTSIYRETNGSVSHVQADALRTQRPTAIISEYTYQPSTQTYERNPRPKASWHVGNQPI